MIIGAVWKHSVHFRNPSVHLDFGAYRAESAFAGFWNVANLIRVIGAGKCEKAEAVRLSAIDNFPNIVSHIPCDQHRAGGKEGGPVFLENLFESERAFGDSFHNGLES